MVEKHNKEFPYTQEINGKVICLPKGYLTLGKLNAFYNVPTWANDIFSRQTSLKWIREYHSQQYKKLLLDGAGIAILDFRIKKNQGIKSKQAMLMRDINYKEIFGVEQALEVHPCFFDSI